MPIDTTLPLPRIAWRSDGATPGARTVPEEVPVALVHNATTTAVMMATPADLEDFAVGFSLTEGLIERVDEIRDVEVAVQPEGLEVRLWLDAEPAAKLAARRRRLAGPTGCGLCGVDSLAEAVRTPREVMPGGAWTPDELLTAMAAMSEQQVLGQATRAVHAAGYWRGGQLVALREDVGRHNALDKLVGALARAKEPADGAILLTSRVSVEMIQKAAAFGAPLVCAVSAPTTLAVRTAEAAGLTLVAVCRADGFEVFTHPERLALG